MTERTPRICACVLMNHPFPGNLPLLRRLYRDRFSEVRFLIPFERLPDEPDVITVYRGSYNHATYLTDAQHILSAIDCDYYVVIQDDVLLNPAIDERTFLATFKLGKDDGFIAWVDRTQEQIGRCVWHFGFVPKFLYPKSQLFGTGIEPETLRRFLPDAGRLAEAIGAGGIASTAATRLDPAAITREQFGHAASRVLLHGLSADINEGSGAQAEVEARSVEAERHLVAAMLGAQRTGPGARLAESEDVVPLPIPTVTGNYFTDCYILPKSGFDDFCHYIGVAGAANLFVEIMAPTLLYAVCERVRTADEVGLDFSGFAQERNLRWFENPRAAAIHPVKLSTFRAPALQDALVAMMDGLARGEPIDADNAVGHLAFGRFPRGFLGRAEGWNEGEDWGVWSAGHDAVIPIALARPGPVRLTLRAPMQGVAPAMTGSVSFNDDGRIAIASGPDTSDVTVAIDRLIPDADGVGRVRLRTDAPIRPHAIDRNSGDDRLLGFGLVTAVALPG